MKKMKKAPKKESKSHQKAFKREPGASRKSFVAAVAASGSVARPVTASRGVTWKRCKACCSAQGRYGGMICGSGGDL